MRPWIDEVRGSDVVLNLVEDEDFEGKLGGADGADVDCLHVERMDVDKDDLGCAVVDIVVDTDPLGLPCVRDSCWLSGSPLPVGFSGLSGSGWLGSTGFGGSGVGGSGFTGAATVIFSILQKNGNNSQKSDRPPEIDIFGISGGPMGGPVLPILYHTPAGPTAMTTAAAAPVLETWPLAAGRGVVIFSADVMLFRFVNVSLYITWLVPSKSIVARSGYGVMI